jgi:hypothetical protein
MASEAQVIANRRNAAKSTGPKSTEGKAAVAQNAVRPASAKTGPVLADLIAVLRARVENKPLPVKLDPQIEEAHWIGTRMVGGAHPTTPTTLI